MALEKLREWLVPGYLAGFGEMTLGKSFKILNIRKGSGISERYRALARINHPDRGGSPYLSEKINQAKKYIDAYYTEI